MNILPDPAVDCFDKCDKKAPTRVLAAAIFCTLERKYFDERTPRAEIATMFQITTAQLTKAVTGLTMCQVLTHIPKIARLQPLQRHQKKLQPMLNCLQVLPPLHQSHPLNQLHQLQP